MKKSFAILLLLLLTFVCAVASAQEYYTLPEIREQAATGWHETYTDKYGRTRQVDIDIDVFGGETAPILKACWSDPLEWLFGSDDDGKWGPLEDVAEAEMKRGGITTYLYEFVRWMDVDPDQRYAEAYGNNLNFREIVAFLEVILKERGIDQEYFLERPYTFDLRYSKHKRTSEILASPTYWLRFLQMEFGLPILSDVSRAFRREIDEPIYLPCLSFDMADSQSYRCRAVDLDVQKILAEDIPLCSIENVIEGAREMIENGYIYQVLSLRFGYVLYTDPAYEWNKRDVATDIPTWYLVPSWVMECYILDDPKSNKLREIPNTWELVINAQTGEMLDWFDTSWHGRGDGRYKGFISWDDVQ